MVEEARSWNSALFVNSDLVQLLAHGELKATRILRMEEVSVLFCDWAGDMKLHARFSQIIVVQNVTILGQKDQ